MEVDLSRFGALEPERQMEERDKGKKLLRLTNAYNTTNQTYFANTVSLSSSRGRWIVHRGIG